MINLQIRVVCNAFCLFDSLHTKHPISYTIQLTKPWIYTRVSLVVMIRVSLIVIERVSLIVIERVSLIVIDRVSKLSIYSVSLFVSSLVIHFIGKSNKSCQSSG